MQAHSRNFSFCWYRASDAHVFSRKAASSSNFNFSFPQLHTNNSRKKGRDDIGMWCGSNMVLLRMRSETCYIFFISSRKPNRRVTCGLWWKLGQVPRVTNFFINPKQIAARAQRAEKPYELTNASRRRCESVLKDFLFSALGVPRWWWRVSSHEWLFDPRTHAHSMHPGRMQVYSPLKKLNVRSFVRGTEKKRKERTRSRCCCRTHWNNNKQLVFKQTCARLIWLNEGGILDLELELLFTRARTGSYELGENLRARRSCNF